MSDSHSQNQRVIKIKPFNQTSEKTEKKVTERKSDQSVEKAQQQLNTLKQEIKTLNNKKDSLIEKAKIEIEKEKQKWQDEKEVLYKQVKDEGYASGFEHGKQESIGEYEKLLNQANSIIETANDEYFKKIKQSEDVILELAVHMAEKVIDTELIEHPEAFTSLVKAAIQEVKDYKKIYIFVHPEQYEKVTQVKTELNQTVGTHVELTILIDYNLKKDSCIIEHPFGRIDASVDTQLEIIKDHLIELGRDSK